MDYRVNYKDASEAGKIEAVKKTVTMNWKKMQEFMRSHMELTKDKELTETGKWFGSYTATIQKDNYVSLDTQIEWEAYDKTFDELQALLIDRVGIWHMPTMENIRSAVKFYEMRPIDEH